MISKKLINKNKQTSVKDHTNKLTTDEIKTRTEERRLAEMVLSSTHTNTITSVGYVTNGTNEKEILNDALAVMEEKVAEINNGNLESLEATLTAQVISLNTIFNTLAVKSRSSDRMNILESYLRLALKAQAQCARTIEVLANIKNPPIVYAKQANIANGHQQVNNGTSRQPSVDDTDKSREGKIKVNQTN